MPIESFTGLPGHGKTSLLVEHLLAQAELGARPLFAAGIDGLKPGLATLLADPREWNAVKPGERCTCHDTEDSAACEAHVVPNGSLIYVDEAWKWFGHLHNATRQANPPHVLQLAEHRHRGIDFVWTFQLPNQIYPFARGLMDLHHHVVRRFGTQLIDVFTWQELNEDVKSASQREMALRKTRALPTAGRDSFKSAELHTIKPRIPWRVAMIPLLVVGALVAGWLAYTKLKPSNMAAMVQGQGVTAGAGATASDLAGGAGKADKPRYASAIDYAKAHLPRFGAMPWTAPVYDEREVTVDPQLFCLSSQAGPDDSGEWKDFSCTCLTEQGTAYELGIHECRRIARLGPVYNPYKRVASSDEQKPETGSGQSVKPIGQPAAAVVSSQVVKRDIFPLNESYKPGG